MRTRTIITLIILSISAAALAAAPRVGRLRLDYAFGPSAVTTDSRSLLVLSIRNTDSRYENTLQPGDSVALLIPIMDSAGGLVTSGGDVSCLSTPDDAAWQWETVEDGVKLSVIGDGFHIGAAGSADDTFAFSFECRVNRHVGICYVSVTQSIDRKRARRLSRKRIPSFPVVKMSPSIELVTRNTYQDEANDSVAKVRLKNAAGDSDKFRVDSEGNVFGNAFFGDGSYLNNVVPEGSLPGTIATDAEVTAAINTHKGDASAHHTKTTSAAELTSGTLDDARLSANVAKQADVTQAIDSHKATSAAHHTKTTDASELSSGVLSDARIPAEIARDNEVASSLNNHLANPAAHHSKTTDAGELVSGVLNDARIPDALARDAEVGEAINAHQAVSNAHHDPPGPATTDALGVVRLATDGETSPGAAVQGNDNRLLTAAQKSELTGGGMTSLHTHGTVDGNSVVLLNPQSAQAGASVNLEGTDNVLSVTNSNPEGWAGWSQRSSAVSPSPRIFATMAYDSSNGVIVLFGGRLHGGPQTNETWLYYTATDTWTQQFPATSPSARYGADMVYDSQNEVLVLFGGVEVGGLPTDDTWTYNVSTNVWTTMSPPTSPPVRAYHAMAYDSNAGVVVLYGGSSDAGFSLLSDTWTYNVSANRWTQKGNGPTKRQHHAMVYDSVNGIVVMYGGETFASNFLDDQTWTYDATNDRWEKQSPVTSPLKRYSHSMAYDSTRGLVVLQGGQKSMGPTNETWFYDVARDNWILRELPTNPGFRLDSLMAYDGKHDTIVLFGGWVTGEGGGTAEYDNQTWVFHDALAALFVGSIHTTENSHAASRTGGGIDLAELVPASVPLPAGTVVCIDPSKDSSLIPCSQPYDTSVAGIISTKPSYLMGVNPRKGHAGQAKLALAGRVPCKVDAKYGAIERGDLLTTSPTTGHAMKVLDRQKAVGAIIGKAMQSLKSGTGVIEVLVCPK